MTRAEVQAVINEMMSEAAISQRSARAAARAGDYAISCGHVGEELGLRRSAQMLTDALEKSEADRGRLINVAATAGAAVVDAQTRLDGTSRSKPVEYERARVALLGAMARKQDADAALARVTP